MQLSSPKNFEWPAYATITSVFKVEANDACFIVFFKWKLHIEEQF